MIIKHKDKLIMLFTDEMLTEISRTLVVVFIHWRNSIPQKQNFKPISQNRKIHQIISSNSDDLLVRDSSCYNCTCGDCFIGKIQSWEKVEFIVYHRRVTMVETACENNYERIDSDSDIIENIVERYGDWSFSFQSESWLLPSRNDNRSRINWTEIFW